MTQDVRDLIADARGAMTERDDTGWFWAGRLADALEVSLGERDAAVAAIERVRLVIINHRSIEQHNEMVPVSDMADLIREPSSVDYLTVLDGAPEPEPTEWVYRARNSILNSGAHVSEETARATLQWMIENHIFEVEPEPVIVERRPRDSWLPVEGESKS